MGVGRTWTPEEKEYLTEHWGEKSVKSIAGKLDRTTEAVLSMRTRLKLNPFLCSGGYITLAQLLINLGFCGRVCKSMEWIKNRGFPVRHKRINKNTFMVVFMKDFWPWAEQNRSLIDWSKVEEGILGAEPRWVRQQRKIDGKRSVLVKRRVAWTKEEDIQLIQLLKQYRYTVGDLSRLLHRSELGIQKRIRVLGLKERPVRASVKKWSKEEFQLIDEMILQGYSYELIAEKLGRTSLQVSKVVFIRYGTSKLDEVRVRMEGVSKCQSQ